MGNQGDLDYLYSNKKYFLCMLYGAIFKEKFCLIFNVLFNFRIVYVLYICINYLQLR